jgi:hypothetical protein
MSRRTLTYLPLIGAVLVMALGLAIASMHAPTAQAHPGKVLSGSVVSGSAVIPLYQPVQFYGSRWCYHHPYQCHRTWWWRHRRWCYHHPYQCHRTWYWRHRRWCYYHPYRCRQAPR